MVKEMLLKRENANVYDTCLPRAFPAHAWADVYQQKQVKWLSAYVTD
jgi:transglutaminase-like putative cysteine protease